jgi:hypothetical protein
MFGLMRGVVLGAIVGTRDPILRLGERIMLCAPATERLNGHATASESTAAVHFIIGPEAPRSCLMEQASHAQCGSDQPTAPIAPEPPC